jgi:hypothetical protein
MLKIRLFPYILFPEQLAEHVIVRFDSILWRAIVTRGCTRVARPLLRVVVSSGV